MTTHDAMTTYRRADGLPCGEAERWTTSGDHLQDEVDCYDEPVTWVAERWVRVGVSEFTLTPGGRAHNPETCSRSLGECPPCMKAFQMVATR